MSNEFNENENRLCQHQPISTRVAFKLLQAFERVGTHEVVKWAKWLKLEFGVSWKNGKREREARGERRRAKE